MYKNSCDYVMKWNLTPYHKNCVAFAGVCYDTTSNLDAF